MNYFKKRHRLKLLLILLAGLLLTFASAAYAIDPPHDALSNCNSCHNADGLNRTSGGNIDNTPQNLLCDECHNPSSNMPKVTHSAKETKTAGKSYIWNASWSYECRGCHNPHHQDQIRMYQDTMTNGGAWIETGLVAQVTDAVNPGVFNVIEVQGNPGWFSYGDPEGYPQLQGFIVQPDTKFPFYYRIVDNTNNTLTVSMPVETAFVGNGDPYGIAYGKMIKTEINSQRTIQNPAGKLYNSPGYNKVTPWRQIVYLLNSGMYSQAPPGESTSPTTKAICVVCHTRTKYNNVGYAVANGPGYNETFDTTINTDYFDHTNSNKHLQINYTSGATSCWDPSLDGCHKPPESGFDAGATCGDCHGDSMSSSSDLVVQIKNIGAYKPIDTGNSVIGAHSSHGGTCSRCHSTGMLDPDDSDNQIGNFTIDISFNIPGSGHNVGTYDGRWPTDMVSSLSGEFLGYQFGYDGNNIGTQNGTMQCNNVYCHAGIVNGTESNPRWNDTDQSAKQCGACHMANGGNPSVFGEHKKHIGVGESSMMDALACTTCHPHSGGSNAAHVNGSVNWTFPSYASALYRSANPGSASSITTGSNYGNCNNLYCHSNGARGIGGASIAYTNPSWNVTGGPMNCNGCHADKNTGTPNWSFPHSEHMKEYSTFSCTDCHDSVVDGNSTVISNSLHINGSAQVVFNATYNGDGTHIAVYGGTTCSNVKCHSTGRRADTSDEYFQSVSWNFGSEQGCNICHKFTATEAQMKTGSNVMSNTHIIHAASDTGNGNYNLDCSKCHNSTTSNGTSITTPANHVDFNRQVSFSDGGVFSNTVQGPKPAYRCENVYCHSDGQGTYQDTPYPVWTDDTSGACGTCHATTNADISAASGKHAKHAQGGASNYSLACVNCHQGVVSSTTSSAAEPTITDVTQHVDGNADVTFGVASSPYGTPTTDDCSNNYCHSNGMPGTRGWTGASDSYSTEDWLTGTALDCGGCHSKQGDAGATWSATHEAHIGTGSNYSSRFDCSACHNQTATDASTLNNKSYHVNEAVDVVFDSTYTVGAGIFDDSGGVGNDFCNNVKCHGTGTGEFATPSWDDTISDCAACHRMAENQAAMDTGARQMSQAHVKHVALDNHGAADRDTLNQSAHSTSNAIQCDNCHNATTTNNTSISNYNNHINFANNVSFNITTDWLTAAGKTPTWSGSATKTCDNVYCHSDGDNTEGTRQFRSVSWSDAPWAGNGCDQCHTMPPTSAGHPGSANNCSQCHPNANTNIPSTGFKPGYEYQHLNGYLDGGSCDVCHGDVPLNLATIINSTYGGGITQRGEDYSSPAGAHGRHANSTGSGGKGIGCMSCHRGGQPSNGTHNDNTYVVNIGFFVNSVEEGWYTAPAFTNSAFSLSNGGTSTGITLSGTSTNADPRTCDNIYCHSDGGDYDNTPINYRNADWDDATINCDACHGDGNNDGAGLLAQTERHSAHVNPSSYSYACFECHNDTVNSDNSIKTEDLHVNFIKDVAFGNLGSDGQGYYTGAATRPDCNNVYCHTRGDANTGTGATAPYTAAAWNDTGFPTASCDGCHGGDASATTAKIDNSRGGGHGYHTNNASVIGDNFECAECHLDTVDSGNDRAIGSGKYVNHVNKLVNVRFGSLNPTGYYAGSASPMSRTPGSALANCENVYCHSDGNANTAARAFDTIGWSGSFSGELCSGCHGTSRSDGAPDHGGTAGQNGANSHPKHVDAPNSIGCQECHWSTTRNGTTIYTGGYHLDGSSNVNNQDVDFNPSNANAASGFYTPTPGDKSCDNTYCHGNSSTLAWGGSTNCATCHAGGTASSLPAKHGVHYTNTLARTEDFATASNFSSSGSYNYSCKVCHNSVTHVGGEVSAGIQAGQVSFDGTVAGGGTYSPGGSSAGNDNGLSYTAGTGCNTTYCHSNGLFGNGAVNANWTTTTLDCGGCHSATGGSAAHSTHTTGSYTANTNVSACDSCHAQTVSDNTTIQNKNYHVNVSNDVTYNTWVDPAGGTTTGYTQGTGCTNTYCHSNGTSLNPSHAAEQWDSAQLDCGGCHGDTSSFTGVHGAHVNDSASQIGFDIGCTECHYQTASDNTTISDYALHVNKTVTIRFDNARNPDSLNPRYDGTLTTGTGYNEPVGDGAGTGCQNVYCHSDGNSNAGSRLYNTVTWSGTLDGCNDCHGVYDGVSYPAYSSAAAGQPGANSHQKHVDAPNSIGCQECHWSTTQDGTTIVASSRHLDGNSNLNNQDVDFNPSNANASSGFYTPTAGDKSCDNTYCHGSSSTLAWGGSTNCASCHGGGTASSLPAKHGVHYTNTLARTEDFATASNFSSSGSYNYSCKVCHDSVTHVGGEVSAGIQAGQVSFDGTVAGGGTYNANTTSAGNDNGLSYTAGTGCNTTYCHSNALFGNGAVNVNWTTSTVDCGGCHSATGGSAAHSTHTGTYSTNANVSACDSCHAQTVSDNTTIENKNYHVNVTNDVTYNTWVDPAGGTTTGYTQGTGCTNTYCHSNGTSLNPSHAAEQWDSAQLDCDACHSTGGLTTVHATHVNDSDNEVGFSIGCTECHNATASDNTTISSVTNHVNKTVTIRFDNGNGLNPDSDNPFYDGNAATGSGYNEPVGDGAGTGCQNVYCHSEGNTNNTSSPGFKTIAWSGSINCDDCHGDGAGKAYSTTATTGAGTGGANSHVSHIESQSYTCNNCHNQTSTTGTSITGANHLNRQEDVNMGGSTSYSGNRCSNTTCHGSSSPQWGDTLADDDYCTICHGAPQNATADGAAAEYTRAPGAGGTGVDTNQQTGTSDPQVGMHDRHLRTWSAGNKISDDLACTNCHAVPATAQTAGHMNGLPAGLTWSALATNGSGTRSTSPTFDGSYNCNNTYCHGDVMPYGSNVNGTNAGSDTSPLWTNDNYIDISSTYNTACGRCHGFPPQGYDADGTHDTMTIGDGTGCSGCHEHFKPGVDANESGWASSPFATVANAALHINRIVEAASCTGCHLQTGDSPTPVNQNPDDSTAAKHDQTEWNNSAHATAGLTCDSCHGGAHPPAASNPWRLRFVTAGTPVTDLNNHCLDCHATGSTNVDGNDSTKKVDSWHYGNLHSGSNSGGQFCFDCHDPHGDGNLFLIQKALAKTSNATYGYPTSLTTNPSFTVNSSPTDYASETSDAGVCQLCHDTTKYFNGVSLAGDYSRGHDATYGSNVCVKCHAHTGKASNDAFAAAGDCDTCHGYPPLQGDSYNNVYTGDAQYDGGKGKHVKHIFNSFMPDLNATEDEYGLAGTGWEQCNICHLGATHKNNTVEISTSTINSIYSFDGVSSPAYIGVRGDEGKAKNCFNVLCHFTRTPRWSEPGTGSVHNE